MPIISEEPTLTKQAAAAFKRDDYETSLILYKKAAKHFGENLFYANIELCKKRMKEGKPRIFSSEPAFNGYGVLKQENKTLKREVAEKDISISERFKELAILTQMLEPEL